MMGHQRQEDDDVEGREWDAQFNSRLEGDIAVAQKKLAMWKRLAIVTTALFFLDCAAVVPFLYGHSLHDHWEQIGKNLVRLAMALLLVCLFCSGTAFNFWNYIRGSKRIQRM